MVQLLGRWTTLASVTLIPTTIPTQDQEANTLLKWSLQFYCDWNRTPMKGGGAKSKSQVTRPLTSEPHLSETR